MKPAAGTYTLTANGMSMQFKIDSGSSEPTGHASFDDFSYNAGPPDAYVATKALVVIFFTDSSHFTAVVGAPPNQTQHQGTYA